MSIQLVLVSLMVSAFAASATSAHPELTLAANEICAEKALSVEDWKRQVVRLEAAYQAPSEVQDDMDLNLRVQISQCTERFFHSTLKRLKSSGARLSDPETNAKFYLASRILGMNAGPLDQYAGKIDLHDISDLRSLTLIARSNRSVTFDQIVEAVEKTSESELPSLQFVLNYTRDFVGPHRLKSQLEMRALRIGLISGSQPKREFLLNAYLMETFKKAFSFTSTSIKKRILELKKQLSMDGNSPETRKYLEEEITNMETVKNGLDYEDLEKFIYQQLVEVAKFEPEDVRKAIERVTASLEQGIHVSGLEIQEGDIILSFDVQGYGGMFYSMVGLNPLFSHSALIFSHHWGPVRYYFVAESLDGLSYRALDDLSSSVVVRMNGSPLKGKTMTAFRNALSRPFVFDSVFRDGLLDSKGVKYSLYCSEFVHYVFKNGLDSKTGEGVSPYDYSIFRLNQENRFLIENIRRLGLIPESKFFVPDQLFFNPQTQTVGFGRFSSRNEKHPSWERSEEQLQIRFHETLGRYFTTRKLRPIGFLERIALETKIKAATLFTELKLDQIDFGQSDNRLYFAKFTIVNEALFKILRFNDLDTSVAMTADQQKDLNARFEREVIPLIEEMF